MDKETRYLSDCYGVASGIIYTTVTKDGCTLECQSAKEVEAFFLDGWEIDAAPISCGVCEGSGFLPRTIGNEIHNEQSPVICAQCDGSGIDPF